MCSSDSPLSEGDQYLLYTLQNEVFRCSSYSPVSECGVYLLHTL